MALLGCVVASFAGASTATTGAEAAELDATGNSKARAAPSTLPAAGPPPLEGLAGFAARDVLWSNTIHTVCAKNAESSSAMTHVRPHTFMVQDE